jgi:RND family efflux transporter MFP subunit
MIEGYGYSLLSVNLTFNIRFLSMAKSWEDCIMAWRTHLSVVMLLVLLLTASGCGIFPQERDSLSPPLAEPVQDEMELASVIKDTIQTQLRGIGSFEPLQVVTHYMKDSGAIVSSLQVRAGQTVQKGDLLVQLDMDGLDILLKQRQLDVKIAEIEFKQAREGQNADDLQVQELKLEIAQMLLKETKEQYESRTVKAQIEGLVTFVEELLPGDWVEAYQPLVNVAAPDAMQLSFQVTNTAAASDVKVGMKADVIIANQNYEGIVVQTPSSAPKVSNRELADEYAKRIYLDVPDRPSSTTFGTHADVRITMQEKANALLIPSSALRTYMGRKYVQILEGESRREVDVETGLQTATVVEIIKGLKEGQKVILP